MLEIILFVVIALVVLRLVSYVAFAFVAWLFSPVTAFVSAIFNTPLTKSNYKFTAVEGSVKDHSLKAMFKATKAFRTKVKDIKERKAEAQQAKKKPAVVNEYTISLWED
jgi:hypothetical protein